MRVATILAVLFVAMAVSILLDPPEIRAFPQVLTREYYFSAPGFGDIVTLDANNDGHLDIIASEQSSPSGNSTFRLFLYNPFEKGYVEDAVVPVLYPHKKLMVDDVNNDGRPDVIVLTDQPATVQVFVQGLKGFRGMNKSDVTLSVPGAIDVAAGTLLGSPMGHDLAVVYPDTVIIYRYLGPVMAYYRPDLNATIGGSSGHQKAIVTDMDGDGQFDLAIASMRGVKIYFGNAGSIDTSGNVNCSLYELNSPLGGDMSIAMADVTSDGMKDMVMAISNKTTREGAVFVIAHTGSSSERSFNHTFTDSRNYTDQLTIADVNGDGHNDIAVVQVTTGDVAFLYQEQGGTFRNQIDLWLKGTTSSGLDEVITSGDFPGSSYVEDGYDDIALRAKTADNSTVSIFYQQDLPVGFSAPIPYQCPSDCPYFNQGESGDNLIDLSDYFYDDHGPIIYNITYQENPGNLRANLDGDGHHLDFTASSGWYGAAEFRVSANDLYQGHEPIESNNFTVMVNARPIITSTPPSRIILGNEFAYIPAVNDPFPAGDYQKFSLVEGPSGMSIDANSGLLRWTPSATGNFSIAFMATDSFGAVSQVQTFTLSVIPPESGPGVPADTILPSNTGTLVAVIAIIASLFLVSSMVVFNENAKYGLLLFFVPLYSKIKREKVLDHFIRGQIFGYIMANPGEHYNSIKQALDITNGSLAHHLRTLERERFIKSKRFGLYRRFYPWAMRVPEDGYFQINEIQKNILDLCRHQPGVSQKELAASLNLTPPTINYHISILAEHGYIRVVRRGRRTQVFVLKGAQIEAH